MNVVSFYRFTNIGNPQQFAESLLAACESNDLLGTVLVADEGVNGTLAGSEAAVESIFHWLRKGMVTVLRTY